MTNDHPAETPDPEIEQDMVLAPRPAPPMRTHLPTPALAAIRAKHKPGLLSLGIPGGELCVECRQSWPCDAAMLYDAQAERLVRAEQPHKPNPERLEHARTRIRLLEADLAAAREQADNGHKLLAAAEKLAERFLAERNQARAEAAEQRGRLRVWSQLTAYLHHGPHCDSISTLPGDCNCGLRGRMQAALASAGASLVSAAPERPDLKAYHAFAAQYDDSSLTIGRVAGMLEEVITYALHVEALHVEAQRDAAREAGMEVQRLLDLSLPSEQTGPEWEQCIRVLLARLEAIEVVLARLGGGAS